jgi:hypothetical protein
MISRFVRPFFRYLVSDYMADPQNDLLMWLMTENQKSQNAEMSSIESLARLLLLINFAAVHSTSSVSDDIPSPPMA